MFTQTIRSLALAAAFAASNLIGTLAPAAAASHPVVTAAAHAQTASVGHTSPMMEDCEGPIVVTYAWQQTSINPDEYAEFFYNFYWNGSFYAACGGGEVVGTQCNFSNSCPPPIIAHQNWLGGGMTQSAMICKKCYAAAIPATENSGEIAIGEVTTKGLKLADALQIGPGLSPVDVATDTSGTLYSAVDAANASAGPSGAYLFAKGATAPTSTLAAPANMQPTGIATDLKRNIYLTANSSSGSQSSALYRYAVDGSGYEKPQAIFASNASQGPLGDVAVSKREQIAVSIPAAGLIDVLSASGQVEEQIATGGTPLSIRLNKAQNEMVVVDGTNYTLSVYSFPKGGLIESGPLNINGQAIVPQSAFFQQ